MNVPLSRRRWLAGAAAGAAAAFLGVEPDARAGDLDDLLRNLPPASVNTAKRAFIRSLLYSREDLDGWLAQKAFPFSKYDPELGYLHINRRIREGMDGAYCDYTYDAAGARTTFACADLPCRVNTYGNSFTSCEQVGDHQTWQEVLAAELGEPARNFGVGGYSVYQAYLRMLREEKRSPAKYIIFNIYDDDHFRNLNGWQRPRFTVRRIATDPPVPHVTVDPDKGAFIERPNPCPTAESLYQLCDVDKACALFADDYGIDRIVRRQLLRAQGAPGVPETEFDDPGSVRHALYATTRIIELVEQFAGANGRRVLYVLSCGAKRIRRFLKEGKRFDAPLVEFLNQRGLAWVNMLDAHVKDIAGANLEAYLAAHYVVPYTAGAASGHYTPLGNFFCAFALRDALAGMLQPPAVAFSATPATH